MNVLRRSPATFAALGTALCAAVAWASSSAAEPRPRALAQLFHQAWGVREGAPGTVVGVTQTADGYLWLAATDGLYRFDGIRFERAIATGATTIASPSRLLAAPDGGLWIAHRSGISRLNDGQITSFGPDDGLPAGLAYDLAMEADGTVWTATRGGVARFIDGRWDAVDLGPDSRPGDAVSVLIDRQGAAWVGTSDGLIVRRPGEHAFAPAPLAGRVTRLGLAPDGSVWVSQPDGVRRAVAPDGRVTADLHVPAAARTMHVDRRGALWLATSERGMLRLRSPAALPAEMEQYGREQQLSGEAAFDIFEDRESNVWVATSGGLDLFRETALVPAELPPRTHAGRLAAAADGSMWVATRNYPLLQWVDGVTRATDVPPPVSAVHVDPRGTVWAWGNDRLWRSTSGGFDALPSPPVTRGSEAWSMAADATGRLWVSFPNDGLFTFANGRWARPPVAGLPADAGRVRVMLADSRGRLWLGYAEEMVAVIDGDRVDVLGPDRGLRIGVVNGIAEAGSRTWIAGSDGVVLEDQGTFRALPGLTSDEVGRIKGIVQADDGSLWLNADRGVVHVAPADVVRLIETPAKRVSLRVYDYLDGSIGGSAPLPAQAAVRGRNGRLWFVGYDSIVWVDPSSLETNVLPPPVHVQSVRAGPVEYAATDEPIRLPIGTTQVQIAYTALSLTMPGRVQFRYALDGVDEQWQDARSRREAYYTNLGPGSYTFRVIAANNDGLWNEAGAAVAFEVPPAFHQTAAFKVLLALSVAGLFVVAYRVRVAQVRGQVQAQLEERIGERERIARELHDTLLQGLQGLILKFQAVSTSLPAGDPVAESLERTLERADRVLVESRDRIRDLRASAEARGDLAAALSQTAEELVAGVAAPTVAVTVSGDTVPLHPVVSDEAYWIGREAIINALKHAAAARIDVEVSYGSGDLRVRCRDDGRGLTAGPAAGGGEHFGMRGMRERAQRIGGRLGVRSHEGRGTEVELRVPAGTAYRRPAGPRRRWWFLKSPGDTVKP